MRKVPSATPTVRLRELREKRQLRRWQLCSQFRVDQSTIQRWEEVGPPKDRIPEVARFFDVSVEHLMGWESEAA